MSNKQRLSQNQLVNDILDPNGDGEFSDDEHGGAFFSSTAFCEDGKCVQDGAAGDQTIASTFKMKFNGQWKQLHKMGERMCCSQNWIRNFNTEIGGGHAWTVDRNQLIPSENFKVINWLEKVIVN